MKEKDVAMAVLWLDGKLVIEEFWEDIKSQEPGEVEQSVRYAFPGGEIEEGETELDAIVREIHEETGIILDTEDKEIKGPQELNEFSVKVYVFRKLLRSGTTVKDGIIICEPHEVIDFYNRDKLMIFTKAYVEQEFVVKDGIIYN